jgi:hypothetical protein
VTVTDDFTKVEVVHLFGIPNEKLPTYQQKEPVGDKPTEVSENLNVELLLRVFEFIKTHPTTWYQSDWFKVVDRETGTAKTYLETFEVEEVNSCGTSFCFAGHVALAEGFPAPPKVNGRYWSRDVNSLDGFDTERVEEFAQKRLGLTYVQSEALFAPDNEMKDLERMVHTLILFPKIKGYDLEEVTGIDTDEEFLAYQIEMARKYVHNNR